MTKSPTDIPILDDDAVGEIQREPWCHSYGDDRLEAPLESRRVAITVGQRDALCQTVRALREQLNEETQYAAELRHRLVMADGVYNEKGEYTRYAQTAINRATDQLQSQLEQVTKERDALRDSASLVAFQAHQIDGDIAMSLLKRGATSMRSACVEKVKAIAETHHALAEKLKGKAMGEMQTIRAEECDIIAGVLESLTLQEQEK